MDTNKDEAINDFLKGLRIVLSNASAYPKDHPYFVKSVEAFKVKVDALFAFLNPLQISVSPDSLFIDGRKWEKQLVYTELAQNFHMRKVKGIELTQGIGIDELVEFLSSLALPVRELLRRGGIQGILKEVRSPHIVMEELDYSQFLRDEGEETKDVWAYLFKEAIDKRDSRKINEFADNFDKIIKKFKAKDFSENEELRDSLYSFLSYLRVTNKEKFCRCAGETLKIFLKNKEAIYDEKLDKIKSLFQDLNNDDFAGMFWDGLLTDESVDNLNFNLFFQIAGQERSKGIADSMAAKAPGRDVLTRTPRVVKKIQELMSGAGSNQVVSDVYRNTLASLFKGITFNETLSFDRALLYDNYRHILLNLVVQEKHKKRVSVIADKLAEAWGVTAKENGFAYMQSLVEVLKERKADAELFEGLQKQIASFLENNIWEKETAPQLAALAETLEKSSQSADFYFNKIFNEKKITPEGLRLFFRFFPQQLNQLYSYLETKRTDMEFLLEMVGVLKDAEVPFKKELLERIFSFSNEMVKVEALKAMHSLPGSDEGFLFSVLQGESTPLKKEALLLLCREKQSCSKGVDILFAIKSHFGVKNKILVEHLSIIEELRIKDAEFYVNALSNKPFFWNKNVRDKAQEVLRNWHARKN